MKKLTFSVGMILLLSLSSVGYTKTGWITVPIDVRFLKTSESSSLDASSEKNKFQANLKVVNNIYKQAKIKFVLKSNQTHSVSEKERKQHNRSKNKKPYSPSREAHKIGDICPNAASKRLLVCVIKSFKRQSTGGFAKKSKRYLIWPARAGWLTKMNPSTLAHELGHLLSLNHAKTKDSYNLMKSGVNLRRSGEYWKLKLTDTQIKNARKKAKSIID